MKKSIKAKTARPTRSAKPAEDLYQTITDSIIARLEQGEIPWKRPWKFSGSPRNISGRQYSGINTLILALKCIDQGWAEPIFATFQQAKKLGGCVRKGEKGTAVVLFQIFEKEEKGKPGIIKKVFCLRHFTVFNVAQIEGLPVRKAAAESDISPIDAAAAIIEAMPNRPEMLEGAAAYYTPSKDTVTLPPFKSFKQAEGFYSVAFHELAHATGHASRLDRKAAFEGSFGTDPYAKEELVAELASCFLCGRAGIIPATLENSAAYIQNWIRRFKDDKKLLLGSASAATKAADFIAGATAEDQAAGEGEGEEAAA